MNETDTNPAAEVSEQATEDRLAALFSDESEEAAPEEDSADEPEAGEEEAAAPEAESDEEEVEYEGKAYKVPKELKEAVLRQSDYTKKTQEVASLRRQVEDKTMYLAAREQLMQAASEDIAELRASEKELERYKSVDWQQLHAADPAQAFAVMQRQRQLEAEIQEKRGRLSTVAQQAMQISQAHIEKQWGMAVEGARQRLGKVSEEDDKAALQQAIELGFTPDELKTRLADERLLIAMFKAAKWDALQKSKPALSKKVADTKPMKPAARSAPGAQQDAKTIQARQALKKTGKADYAEAVLTRMFERKK